MTFASYMELAEAARAKTDAGDRDSALALLSGEEKALPLHAGLIYWLRAALLAELGRTDAALDALDAALEAGCRYRAEWLRDDLRLASLRGLARFDDVVDRAASRHARVQADARPALKALIPTTARPASGYPTLIALMATTAMSRRQSPTGGLRPSSGGSWPCRSRARSARAQGHTPGTTATGFTASSRSIGRLCAKSH